MAGRESDGRESGFGRRESEGPAQYRIPPPALPPPPHPSPRPPPHPSSRASATAAAGFPYRAIIPRPFPAPGVPGMLRCESLTQTYLSGGGPPPGLDGINLPPPRGGGPAL